jgi:uncharacterized membrane protein YidH (DUF202 family)
MLLLILATALAFGGWIAYRHLQLANARFLLDHPSVAAAAVAAEEERQRKRQERKRRQQERWDEWGYILKSLIVMVVIVLVFVYFLGPENSSTPHTSIPHTSIPVAR